MLVRLCYAGPLLYIGLAMALDPAGFVANLGNLEQGIRSFQQNQQGLRGRPPQGATSQPSASRTVNAAFRVAGTALAVIALLHLIGVLS